MIDERRGISTVVATVLIVMLTIAAVALLAQFLIPFIRDTLAKSSECLGYRDYFKFKEEIGDKNYNCYLNNRERYGASIEAIGNDINLNIGGFRWVLIKEDGATKPLSINADATTNNVKMYDPTQKKELIDTLKIPSNGESFTYVYIVPLGSTENYKYAEIYPVLKNERVCEATDRIDLKNCLRVDLR